MANFTAIEYSGIVAPRQINRWATNRARSDPKKSRYDSAWDRRIIVKSIRIAQVLYINWLHHLICVYLSMVKSLPHVINNHRYRFVYIQSDGFVCGPLWFNADRIGDLHDGVCVVNVYVLQRTRVCVCMSLASDNHIK